MRASRAFSLIEVMAAAAILGIGLSATFTAFSSGTRLFEHQRHTTNGIHLSEAKLEELLMRVSSDAELQAGTTFGPEWFDRLGFANIDGKCGVATTGIPESAETCRYRVTWTSVPGGVSKVRSVTVTTAWNEQGQERAVSFTTQRN